MLAAVREEAAAAYARSTAAGMRMPRAGLGWGMGEVGVRDRALEHDRAWPLARPAPIPS